MVEWKKLGEVFEFKNGYTPSKSHPEYWEGGTIPWFRMEDLRQNGGILSDSIQHITPLGVKSSGPFPANTIIVATTATIGEHALLIADSLANQRFTALVRRKSLEQRVLPLFAYYYCFRLDEWCKQHTNVSGFASVDMDGFKRFPFPLPSLSEQSRIVETLDTFTASIDNLKEQITERRKQYEHYRNTLLTFNKDDDSVEWKALGEVGEIYSGKNKEKNAQGTYPVYGSTGIIAYTERYIYDVKQILIARVGANAGFVHIANGQYDVSDNTLVLNIKGNILFNYLYYVLVKLNLNRFAKGGGQPLVTAGGIAKITIPIPSLQEQQRIVSILDTFEASIRNLEAQLVQRQKQYEYYREKMLTF